MIYSKVILPVFLLLLNCVPCAAEVIYFKDGSEVKARITGRNNSTIWVEQGPGSVGFDLDKIERIDSDSGGISKYDIGNLIIRLKELIVKKDYREAQMYCGIILDAEQENVEARYLRGLLSQKMGDEDAAVRDYSWLISANSAGAPVFNNLGVIYARQHRFDSAKTMFDKAIEIDASRPEYHNNLAELFMEIKNFDAAIDEYNKLIGIEPENASAIFNLGVAYKEKGRDDLARRQWEKVMGMAPQDEDARRALGYPGQVTP